MSNPFKAEDKVLIKVKGQQIEATVTQVWNQEVQVRTPEKKLLWRTVKTVTPIGGESTPPAAPDKEESTADGKDPKAESPPPAKPYAEPDKQRKPRTGPALSTKYKRTRARSSKRRKI